MTAQRQYKLFTFNEIEQLKKLYLAGESLNAIADALHRNQSSISAMLTRLIKIEKVLIVRSTPLIALGGIDAAQAAVEKAKKRGSKSIKFLTKNCAYSDITVTKLEEHISRYKLASHLSGVNA